MSAPLVRPYVTYEALSRMAPAESRWEVFDGEVYMSPSPNRRHQELLMRLTIAFSAACRAGDRVYFAPVDVVLADGTAVQPDLIFVRAENASILADVIRGAPDLVAEVLSPSTADRDRGLKMELYARYGVGEYWIVDDEARQVEVHRLDRLIGAYRLVASVGTAETATTPALPALALGLGDLFA